MLGLVKGLVKGFGKKKTKKATKQQEEVSNIKQISGEDLRKREEQPEVQSEAQEQTPAQNSELKENVSAKTVELKTSSTSSTSSSSSSPDFSNMEKKLDESESDEKESRKIGMASAFKGDKDGVQEKDLKKSIVGLKTFIGTELDNVRDDIKMINQSSDKQLGSKLEAIKTVTKDNMEINKDSLDVQKSSFELAKESAYAAAHRAKESIKNAASKVKDKGTALVSAGIGKVKDTVEQQGGIMQTIMKLLAGAYLLKTFWPVIKKHLWPIIKEKLWPFLKDTVWPFIKENFELILGGLGIMSFLKNPIGFLSGAVKLAFKAGGALFKVLSGALGSVAKGVFKVGGKLLQGIGIGLKKTAELAWDGVKDISKELKTVTSGLTQKAKDLGATIGTKIKNAAGAIKDKVKGGAKAAGLWAKDKLSPLTTAISKRVGAIRDSMKEKFAPITKKLSAFSTKAQELGAKALDKVKSASSKLSSIFSGGKGGGKASKVVKGLAGAFKVMKGIVKVVPFLGTIITVWELLDTFFPNFTKSIKEMFSLDKIKALGTSIWDKVVSGISGIADWVSEKMSGVMGTVRDLLASSIAATYGKMPVIGKYANQLANFIRTGDADTAEQKAQKKQDKKEDAQDDAWDKYADGISGNVVNKEVSGYDIVDFSKLKRLPVDDIVSLKGAGSNYSPEDTKEFDRIIKQKQQVKDLLVQAQKKEDSKSPEEKAKDVKTKKVEKAKDIMGANKKTISMLKNGAIRVNEEIIAKKKAAGEDYSKNEQSLASLNTLVEKLQLNIKKQESVIKESEKLQDVKGIKKGTLVEHKDFMNIGSGKKVQITEEQMLKLSELSDKFEVAFNNKDNEAFDKLTEEQDRLRETILREVVEKKSGKTTKDLSAAEVKDTAVNLGLTQFASGGWTGTGKDDEIAGVVHKNEYVLNKEQLKDLDAATTEGEKSNAIKRISDGKGEDVETNLKELMERRKEDSKKSGKDFSFSNNGNKTSVKNVTKAQARDIEKLQDESRNANPMDFDKSEEIDNKLEELLEAINNKTYENKDNTIYTKKEEKKTLAKSDKKDESKTSPEIVKGSTNDTLAIPTEKRAVEVQEVSKKRADEDILVKQKKEAELKLKKSEKDSATKIKEIESKAETAKVSLEAKRKKEDKELKAKYVKEDEQKTDLSKVKKPKAQEVPEDTKFTGKAESFQLNSETVKIDNLTEAQDAYLTSLKAKTNELQEAQRIIEKNDPMASFDSEEYAKLEKEIDANNKKQLDTMKEMRDNTWKDIKETKKKDNTKRSIVASKPKSAEIFKDSKKSKESTEAEMKYATSKTDTSSNYGTSGTEPAEEPAIKDSSSAQSPQLPKAANVSMPSGGSEPKNENKEGSLNLDKIKDEDVFTLSGSAKRGGFKKMNKQQRHNIKAMGYEYAKETGEKMSLGSAYRSVPHQKELFEKKLAKIKKDNPTWSHRKAYASTRHWVAPPGRSAHNTGLAVDIDMRGKGKKSPQVDKAISMGLFEKYKLKRPLAHESWHITPANLSSKEQNRMADKLEGASKKGGVSDEEIISGKFRDSGKNEETASEAEMDYKTTGVKDDTVSSMTSASGSKDEQPVTDDETSSDSNAESQKVSVQSQDTEPYEEKEFDTDTNTGKAMQAKHNKRFEIVPTRKAQYAQQLGELTALGDKATKEQKGRMVKLQKAVDYFPGLEARMIKEETNANDDDFVSDLATDTDGDGNVSTKEHLQAAASEAKDLAMVEMEKMVTMFSGGAGALGDVLGGMGNLGNQMAGTTPEAMEKYGEKEGEEKGFGKTLASIGKNMGGGAAAVLGTTGAAVSTMVGNAAGGIGIGSGGKDLTNSIKATGSKALNGAKETGKSLWQGAKNLFGKKTEAQKEETTGVSDIIEKPKKEIKKDVNYEVQPGDTMSQIAKDKNMSLVTLSNLNPQVEDIDKIIPGSILRIDGEMKPEVVAKGDTDLTKAFAGEAANDSTPLSTEAKALGTDESSESSEGETTKVQGETVPGTNIASLEKPSLTSITGEDVKLDESGNPIESASPLDSLFGAMDGMSAGMLGQMTGATPEAMEKYGDTPGKATGNPMMSGGMMGMAKSIGSSAGNMASGLGGVIGTVAGGAGNMVGNAVTALGGGSMVNSVKATGANLLGSAKEKGSSLMDSAKAKGSKMLGKAKNFFGFGGKEEVSEVSEVSENAENVEVANSPEVSVKDGVDSNITQPKATEQKVPELLNKNVQTGNSLQEVSKKAQEAETKKDDKRIKENIAQVIQVQSKREKSHEPGAATVKLAKATVERREATAETPPTVINNITQGGGTPAAQLNLRNTTANTEDGNMIGLLF